MGEKTNIKLNSRFRLTIPDDLKNHLKLVEDDDIWYELIKDNKAIIGRTQVKKMIIE